MMVMFAMFDFVKMATIKKRGGVLLFAAAILSSRFAIKAWGSSSATAHSQSVPLFWWARFPESNLGILFFKSKSQFKLGMGKNSGKKKKNNSCTQGPP